ncbi:MAG: hypothetical protein HC816_22920 [Leptolyngbyaceae cyanobacterium RM1_1_2]|nr:hypothetical protein [Leptolyngbyaceae cyanobacterium RM1_1_2]
MDKDNLELQKRQLELAEKAVELGIKQRKAKEDLRDRQTARRKGVFWSASCFMLIVWSCYQHPNSLPPLSVLINAAIPAVSGLKRAVKETDK